MTLNMRIRANSVPPQSLVWPIIEINYSGNRAYIEICDYKNRIA